MQFCETMQKEKKQKPSWFNKVKNAISKKR